MDNIASEKIARLLRVDKHIIADLEVAMDRATGKRGVFKRIVDENESLIVDRLHALGVPSRDAEAVEIYDALISKVEADDLKIFNVLHIGSVMHPEAAQIVCRFIRELIPPTSGYFLKLTKAREFLVAEPPKKILAALGYDTVDAMLAHEDILEIYSALRFLEDQSWQNEVFFRQYERLTPDDFEVRGVQLKPLNQKWASAAEKFVKKKYHNVSHLKELGVIFIIPVFLGISGEVLRLISLLLHYLREVAYYSSLFQEYARAHSEHFAAQVISLLRGDVLEHQLPVSIEDPPRARWIVIQRYLAKDDVNDWRLFVPHVNPEAMHWMRAERDIVHIADVVPEFKHDGLHFWGGVGWVGDYFQSETGVPILVSFNIVDTVMSLVKEKELAKYLYHQEEALWNRIFTGYFSETELEQFTKKYIIQGWFEV